MPLKQENVENWMEMHLCKNPDIEKRKWDMKIRELIHHFSKHVADGDMKYYSAVRGLEEYVLKNIKSFDGTYADWLRVQKIKKRRTRQKSQNLTKDVQIKQYVMDAIDYYSKVREKYDQEYKIKLENQKSKFDETREFTVH